MTDFDYDVLQKKRTARGAQHRKGGSKSKRCTLPHELMTKKELRAMNGPMKTYNINKPMTLKEFKYLPGDLRKTYLTKLVQEFHANDSMIAEMFGCTAGNVKAYRTALGVKSLGSGPKSQPSSEWVENWNAFLNGPMEDNQPVTEDTPPEVEDNQPVIEDNPPEVEDNQPVTENNSPAVEDDQPSIKDFFVDGTKRMQFDAVTTSIATYLERIGYTAESLMAGKVRVRLLIESVAE